MNNDIFATIQCENVVPTTDESLDGAPAFCVLCGQRMQIAALVGQVEELKKELKLVSFCGCGAEMNHVCSGTCERDD